MTASILANHQRQHLGAADTVARIKTLALAVYNSRTTMPEPTEGEARQDFLDRCIPTVLDDGTAADQEQAVAICNSMYDQGQNAYQCECLNCGHIFTSAAHCQDATCPECGSEDVRRANRPGVGNRKFQTMRVNAGGEDVRTERVDGYEYLVAPVIIICEGVLNDEYVSAQEILYRWEAWNGRPFVVDHPTRNGDYISANDPLILAGLDDTVEGGILAGRLYNTRPGDGKIHSEIWLDKASARSKGGDVYEVFQRLSTYQPLEVSTGYWRDVDPTPGVHNGQPYVRSAHNLVPDHVAALPNARGACSWEDGCGAPRINQHQEAPMKPNLLSEARRPTYTGTSTGEWNAPALEDFGYGSTVADLDAEQRTSIAETSLLGDPEADTYDDLVFFPVVSPDGDLYESALDAVISGRGAQADIPDDAKASAQRMARTLLNEEFDRDLEVDVETNVNEEALTFWANAGRQARAFFESFLTARAAQEQETETMTRQEMIEQLLGHEGVTLEREALEGLNDCTLNAMHTLAFSESDVDDEPTPDPDPAPAPETNDDDLEPGPTADEGSDLEAKIEALEARITQATDALAALTQERQQSVDEQRDAIITELSANESCALSEDQLKALDLETLQSLRKSFVKPNYSGQGGFENPTAQAEGTFRRSPMRVKEA